MTHFYDTIPPAIKSLSNRAAIEEYARRSTEPQRIIAGLAPEQLNSHPVPGTWSLQQLIVHLMDTDQVASYRMKRIVAEDRPVVDCYDENAFIARLCPEALDTGRVCEAFRLNRLTTGDMLRTLPDSTFSRVAMHPEIGEISLGQLLRLYVHHVDHHMRFAEEKRARLLGGRPGGS